MAELSIFVQKEDENRAATSNESNVVRLPIRPQKTVEEIRCTPHAPPDYQSPKS